LKRKIQNYNYFFLRNIFRCSKNN